MPSQGGELSVHLADGPLTIQRTGGTVNSNSTPVAGSRTKSVAQVVALLCSAYPMDRMPAAGSAVHRERVFHARHCPMIVSDRYLPHNPREAQREHPQTV